MASLAKEVVLITGANSGIGYELARQLLSKGSYHVLLGARSADRGTTALHTIQSQHPQHSPNISFLPLDLASDTSITAATTHITTTHGRLDIIINNAAVASYTAPDRSAFRTAFDTNATGPYLLTKSLISLLRQSPNPRIVNVSSGAGSIGRRLTPASPMYKIQAEPYRASKVAMNMLTACLYVEYGLNYGVEGEEAKEGEERRVKVFAYDPGFTISNLSKANTVENGARSAEETVRSLVEVVEGRRDGEVGRFLHNTGEYPW
ncbi:hypothetical protein E8E13_008360 [Curvularia kusanoi]|uniref:NAD(P)-binding protein n=1 Tax=Curvularia kusanoi TaxID=90978 RepID=A0A9P4TNP9_CURKU|nr:hypothetical protein E8E13_008360 [Curvularia kusanoi]